MNGRSRINMKYMAFGMILIYMFLFSQSFAWYSGWQHRKPITIQENSGNVLTDYQVPINITYDTGMQPDFSDIRFTWLNTSDNTEQEIPYWIEQKVDSSWAYVWVKVPEIPANGQAIIYVYYGNITVVTSESNGTATFDFFDDFDVDKNYPACGSGSGSYSVSNSVVTITETAAGIGIDYGIQLTSSFTVNGDGSQMVMAKCQPTVLKELHTIHFADCATLNDATRAYKWAGSQSWGLAMEKPYSGSGFQIVYAILDDFSGTGIIAIGEDDDSTASAKSECEWILVRKYTDPEPTYNIGAEETSNQPPQISISSPQNTTYSTTNITASFTVTDDSPATFHLKAYLDGNLIYDNPDYENKMEVTLDLTPYLTEEKQYNFTVWANDNDASSPQTSEQTVLFSLDLYDLSLSLSNYVAYNNNKYAKEIKYSYTARCGYLGKNATILVEANNTEIHRKEIVCDNSIVEFQGSYQHNNEGNVTITTKLLNYNNITKEEISDSYMSDLTPPHTSISYNFTYGFRNNIQEQVNFSVSDTISPAQFCDISINQHSNNVTLSNNQTSYTFNLRDGNNIFEIKCRDLVNNQKTISETPFVYVKKLIVVEEDTGDNFTSFADMDTLRAISEKTQKIYNFLADNTTEIYFVSSEPDTIRIEKRYAQNPNDLLFIDLNLGLIPEETRVCVAKPQTFYEIAFYSTSNKPVAVVNNLAQCYVLADYTKYAYQDALMAKAYTIKALYYLYTFVDGQKVFLSTIDGSVATSVALDVLESAKKTYTFTLATDDVSISKVTNTTLKIYYKNMNNDNIKVDIKIIDGDNTIFSHTETQNPNEYTLYFDYSTLNIQNDLLKIVVTKHKKDGSTQTISKIFNLNGASGLLHPNIAIVLASVLIFFSLTFVAIRYVFGWFGMITLIIALAMTTLAPPTPAIVLLQVLIVIMFIFIALIYKDEHAPIT